MMASKRAHGTVSAYSAGCRCKLCRDASAAWKRNAYRQAAYGRWEPYVDAEPVRGWVRELMAVGIGWQQVAALADVSKATVANLIYGDPRRGNAPSKRIRPETARRLLAVSKDPSNIVKWVDAVGSCRRLRAMAVNGWTMKALASRCSLADQTLGDIASGRRAQIWASTAQEIRSLFTQMWNKQPPEGTLRERRAAGIARSIAKRNGWMPVGAWDDIDNPDAIPDLGEKVSREQALAEDADELINSQGYTLQNAAERLGVSVSYLGDARLRTRKRAAGAVKA